MDPVIISLIALIVSILSFGISLYQSGVNRQLQFEQIRGNLLNDLTSRGLELTLEVQELLLYLESKSPEKLEQGIKVVNKLKKILEGIEEMRKSLKNLESPPFFSSSKLLTNFAPIQSEIKDAEIVYDKLFAALEDKNLPMISSTADGIIERMYGSKNV